MDVGAILAEMPRIWDGMSRLSLGSNTMVVDRLHDARDEGAEVAEKAYARAQTGYAAVGERYLEALRDLCWK